SGGTASEPDVGIENHSDPSHDAGPTELAKSGTGRNEWHPVRRVNVRKTERDKEDNDYHFDRDDDGVNSGGFTDTEDQECGNSKDDQDCRQIDDRSRDAP